MPRGRRWESPEQRFQHVLDNLDATGPCWLWKLGTDSRGYGRIGWMEGERFIQKRIHQYVWEELVGPIPEGLEPDHLCRVHLCANPDHLEMVSPGENTRRGIAGISLRRYGDDGVTPICPKGHEKVPHPSRPGRFNCLICNRDRGRRQRAEQRRRNGEVD